MTQITTELVDKRNWYANHYEEVVRELQISFENSDSEENKQRIFNYVKSEFEINRPEIFQRFLWIVSGYTDMWNKNRNLLLSANQENLPKATQ